MNLIEKIYAQERIPTISVAPANSATIQSLASSIINVILMIAGILAVIYLIYSGILYITAAGNPDNAKKGQQGVVNAIIGLVVIVLAFVIVRAVTNTAAGINAN